MKYSSISFMHSHDISSTRMKSGRQRFLVFTTLFGGNSGLVTVLIWRFDDGGRLFASWVLLRDTLAVHLVNLVDYDLDDPLYQKDHLVFSQQFSSSTIPGPTTSQLTSRHISLWEATTFIFKGILTHTVFMVLGVQWNSPMFFPTDNLASSQKCW